jgi:hypothetical protein
MESRCAEIRNMLFRYQLCFCCLIQILEMVSRESPKLGMRRLISLLIFILFNVMHLMLLSTRGSLWVMSIRSSLILKDLIIDLLGRRGTRLSDNLGCCIVLFNILLLKVQCLYFLNSLIDLLNQELVVEIIKIQ